MQLFSKLRSYKIVFFLLIAILIRILFFGVGEASSKTSIGLFSTLRLHMYSTYLKILPSPHSELLAGMVLGLDELQSVPTFNDILVETGTIHVVVVSGFNIVIFFNFLQRIVGSIYKFKNLLIAEIVSLIYAVFTGFEYPVIRAWVMCTIIYLAKFLGIKSSSFYILLVTGLCMLAFDPLALYDMSFQLSFLAVAGLMIFSEYFESVYSRLLPRKRTPFYVKDMLSSLSAQMLVWPLISLKIGTLNLFSPFTNALLLWPISYATALGLIISLVYKSPILTKAFSILVYPYLDYFVEGSYFCSRILPSQINFQVALSVALIYYFIICIFVFRKGLLK